MKDTAIDGRDDLIKNDADRNFTCQGKPLASFFTMQLFHFSRNINTEKLRLSGGAVGINSELYLA
jgi:hypothetical protein